MIDFSQINPILNFTLIIAAIFGGGVTAFLIIRIQLIKVLKDELKIYKDKVDRLEREVIMLTDKLKLISTENLSLITERDYLKSLIVSSITSKKEIHAELLRELKNADEKTQVFSKKKTVE